MRHLTLAAAAFAAAAQPSLASAQCAMSLLTRHGDPHRTRIYAAAGGVPAVYFRADADVNTDGASRSYHPADPRGRSRALNNIANAISRIRDAQGHVIDCSPRSRACFTRYITTFEAARDAAWNPSGHPSVETSGIIPWRQDASLGRRVPCTIGAGPYSGYFVSQTAFIADPAKGACDQARYLDSVVFNGAVLPRNALWTSLGKRARVGDLVVMRAPATGRTVYAIVGDVGPQRSIGEGTIALAAALRGAAVSPAATYPEIKALALPDVQYVLFPGAGIRERVPGALTQADIDREARQLFDRWGGEARLGQCAALAR